MSEKKKKDGDLSFGRKDTGCVLILAVFFAVLYIFLMYRTVPDIDEIGMYEWFSHHGLLYSVTQWIAPGNHIFYLAVSSVFDGITKDAVWGMRGAATLAAVVNTILFFCLVKKHLHTDRTVAFFAALFYGLTYGVMDYAVRGRGYTFCNLFFLLAFLSLGPVCRKEKKGYLLLVVSFVLGLYTVPTFLYCILPVTLYLLIDLIRRKDGKQFRNLLICAVITGVAMLLLYFPVLLCLGIRQVDPEIKNMSFNFETAKNALQMFAERPFYVLKAGFDFFWQETTHFTGRIPLQEVCDGIVQQLKEIFVFTTPGNQLWFALIVITGSLAGLGIFARKEKENGVTWVALIALLIFIPVMFLQSVLPFIRVYLYLSAPVSIGVAALLKEVKDNTKKDGIYIAAGCLCAVGLLLWGMTGLLHTKGEWGGIYALCEKVDWKKIDKILPNGHIQEQFAQYWEIREKKAGVDFDYDTPQLAIIGRDEFWSDRVAYEDLPWDYIRDNMFVFFEEDDVTGYIVDTGFLK